MAGTKTFGISSIVQALDLLGNKSVCARAVPVLLLGVISGAAWIVVDLLYSIPRAVGRRLTASLTKPKLAESGANTAHSVLDPFDLRTTPVAAM